MRVGVLGLGSIGLRHARNLINLGVEVVGFDPIEARRNLLLQAGAHATADRAAALNSVEAVVVASPSHLHLDDVRESIERRCHTFVEKPLATSSEGVRELLAKAAALGRIVFPALNLRYHPVVQEAKDILKSGDLGQALWGRLLLSSYLPEWRSNADYRRNYTADPRTGGILFDDIHEFDLATYLLGPAVVVAAVARRTGELEIAAEDCADIIFRHESGVHSSLHCDYASKVRQRIVEISCQGGLMRLDLMRRELQLINADGRVTTTAAGGTAADDYVAEARDFLDCLAGRSVPRCLPAEAVAVLEQVILARTLAGLPS